MVDECRRSGNVSEGIATAIAEVSTLRDKPFARVTSADSFIPLAEAAGLMGPLTTLVLRQALTTCKSWQRRGGRIGVAVNVSAETLLDPMFATEVAALLTAANVSPDLLTLELTEGVVVNDAALAAQRMTTLRQLGVKLSVDDFGTGYSSLTYLKGLPVDEVKIDKGFVDANAILDDTARTAKFNEIDKMLWDDMVTIPLYQKPTFIAFSDKYVNIGDNASGAGPFWNVGQWGLK